MMNRKEKIMRGINLSIILTSALTMTACLMFKDDPLFSCEEESDCTGKMKCVIETFSATGICRDDDWCEKDAHCEDKETCVEGKCTLLGGEGGQCRDDDDCGALSCIDFVCTVVGGIDGYCIDDDQCKDGYECRNAQCTCISSEEICDGIDNDCDGQVDEDLSTATVSCGEGGCERTAEVVCRNGADHTMFIPGTPEEEVCDGVDNDCDGITDEGFGTTTCGEGECEVTIDICADGKEQECEPGAPSDDICDGLDNDCDGFTDNDPDLRLEILDDIVIDHCLGITWQRGGSDVMGERNGGQEYCGDLVLDGDTDWRLASHYQYRSILNSTPCEKSPLCDPMFPEETATYWAYPSDTVDLETGVLTDTPIGNTNAGYFRCVRTTDPFSAIESRCDGPKSGEWIFIENGIVDDACYESGLMWQQVASEDEYTYTSASDYCDALTLGGYTDWRLPSSEEFMAILGGCTEGYWGGNFFCSSCPHVGRCNLMFNGDIIWLWTNDHLPVNLLTGEVANGFEDYNDFYVRCVREK